MHEIANDQVPDKPARIPQISDDLKSSIEKQLTVIIPAYNEELRIGSTLEEYAAYFDNLYGNQMEILVVLNGCRDRTEDVVSQIASRYPQIRYLLFPIRLGKGGAITQGLKCATSAQICFVDADNMVGPDQVEKLIRALDQCDLAIGSRWKGANRIQPYRPPHRRVLTIAARVWARWFLGLDFLDTQCGAKAIRGEILPILLQNLSEQGWAFDLELLALAKKQGLKVDEIPVEWTHVARGSKVRILADGPHTLLGAVRIWWRQLRAH